jgi:hypothetical protein
VSRDLAQDKFWLRIPIRGLHLAHDFGQLHTFCVYVFRADARGWAAVAGQQGCVSDQLTD